ncbi:ATP-binding protein [Pedobacter mucosus]|uniref:ATP-binding protein n=1 Tax=Pedobacter mucosus TaxID=2895286 RepID=UPI001EE470B8|nr:ATP-binding protein [Pedobacter mucosus]UKT64913.1 GAF domain-containing protein [Pedobacter mucosus]
MNEFKVDLSNCDIEPIHILGKIQSHGFLVAINNKTQVISYISENVNLLIKDKAQNYIGKTFETLEQQIDFNISGAHLTINQLVTIGSNGREPEINNPLYLEINKIPYYLIVTLSGEDKLLEFEPIDSDLKTDLNHTIGRSMSGILSAKNLDSMLQITADEIKKIINYDRVMVYKFSEEGHGKILAEAKIDILDPFLGLHYPASDIPKQARELYKRNLTRIIADVNSVDSSILALPDHQPLNLTHSNLRAVSPIHIQYLRNMGVVSSFSISLISGGELWGLIVCHNYKPRFINYKAREASKLLGQVLSSALEHRQGEEDSEIFLSYNENVNDLIDYLEKDDDVTVALTASKISLKDVTAATGVALIFEGKITTVGITPSEKQIEEIADWLKINMSETIYHTHRFPQIYLPAVNYCHSASGLLACSLSKELGEFILWFKPEQINQISWAGNPEKALEKGKDGIMQLNPRKSFESWTDIVKNTSGRWNRAEVSAVINLREHITYIIIRKANEIRRLNELLKQSAEELNIFSYTVTHDLRTPLSAIKSYSELLLINNKSIDEQAKKVLTRITACADKMALLIKEILNYSNLGKADIEVHNLEMNVMINMIKTDVLEGLQPQNIEFEIGETPSIVGDSNLINQVFTNLISNAVKYSSKSNPSKVSINGVKKGEDVIYTITDNGIGIDDKYHNLVFDLFKRMDNVKDFEGTGVGLAIVKRIMEKHNGKVWFESKLELGTKFYLSFKCPH